jgi:sarcosine oxidase subunit beta
MPVDDTDVAVVGGGAVGVSIAYFLAESGVDVSLFEANRLGDGSTVRSAGGIRQQFGDETRIALAMRSRALFDRFASRTDGSELHETGYLYLAQTADEADGFVRDASTQREMGLPVELVDPDECARHVPGLRTDDLALGKYCSTDCFTDPGAFTRWLGARAASAGATLHEGRPVTAVRVEDGRATGVETEAGTVACRTVVNAAGVWADAVARTADSSLAITPARIQVVVADGEFVPSTAPFVVDVHERRYCRPTTGGTLVGGSNVGETGTHDPDGYESDYDDAFVDQSASFVAHRFGADADSFAVVDGWAGLKGLTPDGLPLLGELDAVEGLFVAAGFNGHGFMLAPAVGEALADRLRSGSWGDARFDAYDPDRFADSDGDGVDEGGFMGIS